MPNDISVQAVAVARTGSDGATDTKLAAASALPPQAEPSPPPSPVINPTLRLDAALGLVVIEIRNDAGAVTTSIPSERQIAAYQRWDVTHFGPAPMGLDETVAAALSTVKHAVLASATERRPAQAATDTTPSPPPARGSTARSARS
jgi:hypothetical protein